jgi:hypothetical protein
MLTRQSNAKDVTNVWRQGVVLIFNHMGLIHAVQDSRPLVKPSLGCEGRERRCVSMQGQYTTQTHLQLASQLKGSKW